MPKTSTAPLQIVQPAAQPALPSSAATARSFYDSFFELVESYLKQDKDSP